MTRLFPTPAPESTVQLAMHFSAPPAAWLAPKLKGLASPKTESNGRNHPVELPRSQNQRRRIHTHGKTKSWGSTSPKTPSTPPAVAALEKAAPLAPSVVVVMPSPAEPGCTAVTVISVPSEDSVTRALVSGSERMTAIRLTMVVPASRSKVLT